MFFEPISKVIPAPALFGDGTVAAPAITFADDTDLGFYRIGADQLGISVGGTKAAEWNNSGLVITGDLTVQGTTTQIDSQISIEDPLTKHGDGNTTDTIDLGFYGEYDTGTTAKYAGFFRDASDGKFRLFVDLQAEPASTVNIAGTGYTVATLVANVEATTLSVSGTFTSGDYTSSGTVTANKFASAVHDEELARNYTQADNTAATTVFSFAHATYQGCYCDYVLRRGTAHSRIGTLKVIQLNGSTVSLDDTGTDEAGSGSPGTTWSAAVNGSNIDVKLAVDNSDTDDVFVTYHARFLKVYSA